VEEPVMPNKILLVALGGNALVRKGGSGSIAEQFENLKTPIRQIARLTKDYRVIITHGNGPQVGDLLLRQECCKASSRLPLEILVAQTQGQIGYMIESSLDSAFMEMEDESKPLVSLISYVVVDQDDPAFRDPVKPIGPAYSEEAARALPFPVARTPIGFRRVVASPRPITIVEKREIQRLIESGFVVICCGGGGIPVVREGRTFCGVDAVIDKDLASARLAGEVGVDLFLIATDVEGAYLNYGEANQTLLGRITAREAENYLREGHFAPGSMGPKIEAAVGFTKQGGGKAVITSLESIEGAVMGKTGTEIVI
jgi:carbamate kinase